MLDKLSYAFFYIEFTILSRFCWSTSINLPSSDSSVGKSEIEGDAAVPRATEVTTLPSLFILLPLHPRPRQFAILILKRLT